MTNMMLELKDEGLALARRAFCALAAVAMLSGMMSHADAQEASARPDFRGVWVPFAVTPAGRLGPSRPDLTAEGQAAVDAFREEYGEGAPEPGWYCVPQGMPYVMTSLAAYPIEILQDEDQLTMLAEMEMQVRRIYLDGRGHPDDYPPTRIGHSVGTWEDDALVIDTMLLKPWPMDGMPRSEDQHIIERLSLTTMDKIDVPQAPFVSTIGRISDRVIVNKMTIIDPKMYPEPVDITIYYKEISDTNILEYDCPVDLWQRALEEHKQAKEGS